MSENEPVFACTLEALTAEERVEHEANARQLFATVLESQPLPLGFRWRFPNERETFQRLATYISNERLCCSFQRFELEVEPERGAVWLQVTASRDIKPFLQSEGWFSAEGQPLFAA